MARDRELTGLGIPPLVAKMLGSTAPVTGLSGAGTSQSDGTALTSNFSVFSTVASSSGAVLPAAGAQGPYMVVNDGANALLVYPSTGQKINNGTATSGSFSVTNAKSAIFIPVENQWFAILSA